MQSCFYECKQSQTPSNAADDSAVKSGSVLEDTLLMLVNENPAESLIALVLVLDGNQRPIVQFKTHLSPLDLDEINICRTFELSGFVPPQAGVVEIVSLKTDGVTGEGGVYAWVKDMAGKGIDTWKRPAPPALALARKVEGGDSVIPPANARKVMATIHSKVSGVGKTECRITPPEVFEDQPIRATGPSSIQLVLSKIGDT